MVGDGAAGWGARGEGGGGNKGSAGKGRGRPCARERGGPLPCRVGRDCIGLYCGWSRWDTDAMGREYKRGQALGGRRATRRIHLRAIRDALLRTTRPAADHAGNRSRQRPGHSEPQLAARVPRSEKEGTAPGAMPTPSALALTPAPPRWAMDVQTPCKHRQDQHREEHF